MGCKKICAQIYVKDGCAFNSYEATEKITESGDISELAEMFENRGADCIFIYDLSEDDVSHERTILAIRSITSNLISSLISILSLQKPMTKNSTTSEEPTATNIGSMPAITAHGPPPLKFTGD